MATKKKFFSVEEANALVPRLCMVFQRLAELKEEIAARANEVERMGFSASVGEARAIPPEIHERRRIIQTRVADFQREIKSIEELGATLKDLDLGLVDFPAKIGGEEVLLCWQFGEPTVTHFHTLDGGFASRKPIEGAERPLSH